MNFKRFKIWSSLFIFIFCLGYKANGQVIFSDSVFISTFFPKTATVGSEIFIYGKGFSKVNNLKLNIGNDSSKVISVSDSKVIVQIPFLEPGPYEIALYDGFQKISDLKGLTVLIPKTPYFNDGVEFVSGLTRVTEIFSVDLNGNNKMDFLVTNRMDGSVSWFENRFPYFSRRILNRNVNIGGSGDKLRSTYSDLNLDGMPDIIVGETVGAISIKSYQNSEDHDKRFKEVYDISKDLWFDSNIIPLDVNLDGWMDIVSGFSYGFGKKSKVLWARNMKDNTFWIQENIGEESEKRINRLINSDLNNDGFQDIVVLQGIGDEEFEINWYRNYGDGNFSEKISITDSLVGTGEIHAIDIDNDKDFDLIIASGNDPITGGGIIKFENTGDGTFLPPKLIYKYNSVYSLSLIFVDLDGDKDQDMVVGSAGSVMWLSNDGEGNFATEQNFIYGFEGTSVVNTTDIDNDGDLDIIATTGFDGGLVYLENVVGYEEELPNQPELLYPIDISVQLLTSSDSYLFEWNSSENSEKYQFQLGTVRFKDDKIFSELVLDTTTVDTTLFFDGLPEDWSDGARFKWRVRGINEKGLGSWSSLEYYQIVNNESHLNAPKDFKLYQNYPNPFNPSTQIEYTLPYSAQISLRVFDLLGREVEVLVNERQAVGKYKVVFDASSLSSGIYFFHLDAGSYSETKKLTLIK